METITKTAPRAHVRINIEKNTKGYNTETTISLDYDLPDIQTAPFDEISKHIVRANSIIESLLSDADAQARDEVARRVWADNEQERKNG